MGHKPRQRPKQLPAKLHAIRRKLGLNQPQLAQQLAIDNRRISELESGRREPNLILLLRYAHIAGVCTDVLIDDNVGLEDFWLEPR